jgi:hypothetical protein
MPQFKNARKRMHAGWHAWAATTLVVLTAGASHVQAQENWAKMEGPVYVFVWSNRAMFAPGDTLRIRVMLLNAADSAVTLNVRPCGIGVVTLLQLRDVAQRAGCATEPRKLMPGDSIWAEYAGVVSTPGRADVEVRYAAHAVTENSLAAMGAFTVIVSQTARRSDSAKMVERMPYAVRPMVASEFFGLTGVDARNVIRRAITTRPFAAIEFLPETAAKASVSHFLIDAEIGARGEYTFRSRWLPRGVTQGASPCDTTVTGNGLNAITFGTSLTSFVGGVLDRVAQGCRR